MKLGDSMRRNLEFLREEFLERVKDFKSKLHSTSKIVRFASYVGKLRFVLFETLVVFALFTPLFLMTFSAGVILLSNFVDLLFLSFLCSSLLVVLPINVISTFWAKQTEIKAVKSDKSLLDIGKTIIEEELKFLQLFLNADVKLQNKLGEEKLVSMILEKDGKKLAYGPRELVFHVKNDLQFFIRDTEVFNDQYGKFLIFQFNIPFRFETPFSVTVSVKEEREKTKKNDVVVPEWSHEIANLLRKYITLSKSERILLHVKENVLRIIICDYLPLGSLEYSNFLQELKEFMQDRFSNS